MTVFIQPLDEGTVLTQVRGTGTDRVHAASGQSTPG